MIINRSGSKSFLNKYLPVGRITDEDIVKVWKHISDYVTDNVNATNDVNDLMLKSLDDTAKRSSYSLSKIKNLSSMLADLYAISGASRTSFSAFDSVNVQGNSISVNRDLFNIKLASLPSSLHTPKLVKVFTRNGQLGNSVDGDTIMYNDIENIVGSHSRLEVESFNSDLLCTIYIDLGSEKAVNNLTFKLTNFGTRLPELESIESSSDNSRFTSQRIVASNDSSIDFDDYRFGEYIVLDTSEFKARYIKLNFVQKYPYIVDGTKDKRYAIGISSLRASFSSALDQGSVILGPFKSVSEIVKASVDADITGLDMEKNNVSFELSHNGDTWIPIENSSIFNPSNVLPKIISYNTSDASSVSTEDSVNQIFLKINMTSNDASYLKSNNASISRFRSRLTRTNRNIFTGDESGEVLVFKSLDFKYGGRTGAARGESILNRDSIIDFVSNNSLRVRSIGVSGDNIVDVSTKYIDVESNITTRNSGDKCFVKASDIIICQPSEDFDPYNINTFKYSKPIISPVQAESKDRVFKSDKFIPVLPFSEPSGLYFINDGHRVVSVDLSEGFFYSNSQCIYVVKDDVENVIISNEIGEEIATLDVKEYGDLKFISLFDAFTIQMPEHDSLTYNHQYPLTPLGKNEFSIEGGRVVFNSYFKSKIILPRVIVEKLPHTIVSGIDNMKRISLNSNKQIKTSYSLHGNDYKKTVKLRDTNILEGSVGFDLSKASVNAFIREVPFIDGDTEFSLSGKYIQSNNSGLNVINLHKNYLDDGEIEFSGLNHLFISRVYSADELIEAGDYLINLEDAPRIILPEGVYTDDVIDIEISYNIEADKISTSGLYSIDYARGILHTAAPIDHKTIISYKYSFVFAEYEALERMDTSSYVISPSSITVTKDSDESGDYIALIVNDLADSSDYKASPVINKLNINTITVEDFL